ncbi:efflux RND transporter permease subunit [Verrucomicrobiales bacterium]|nr:efflux RND transporter permease subunit [Verrucomicrobiales bacterium]
MNSNGFPNGKARKEHEDPWKADLFFVLVRIIKDPDVGFFRPEEFLCSFEGVACREIRIASVVEKDVFSPDNINRSGIFQNTERYPGISYSFEGEQKDQAQSVKEMGQKALVALLGMYVLMAIPLRSYIQPMIVMSVIPFGLVGAVAGHMVMGFSLSIMSMCGIVALAGVVVNDSLVLVDYVNRHVKDGQSLHDAAWEAGAARFRPILLTSMTTFAGLTPMLLETDIQAKFLIPMAVSLSFGILFATLITLILVPCIYLVLEDISQLFGMDRTNHLRKAR